MIISNSNTSFYEFFIQILSKFVRDTKILPLAILSIFLIAITACGSGSSSYNNPTTNTNDVSLQSITLTPVISPNTTAYQSASVSPISVPLGITQLFVATGFYSDGSKRDITSSVTWTSSQTSFATINNSPGLNGVLTPVAPGITIVSATIDTFSESISVTITNAFLKSINVTPARASTQLGINKQFTAIGTYSDETTRDITNAATWSSSFPSVSTVSNTPGSKGLVTPVGFGYDFIDATLYGITNSGELLVTNTAFESTVWAYVANQSAGNAVSYCSINIAGSLSECMSTGSGFANPNGIAINNGYAYINNISNNSVSLCSVDPVLGSLSGCITTASGTPFAAPSQLVINNGFAFIDNIGNNTVVVCSVNPSSGALFACNDSGVGSIFNGPSGLAIKNGFAYIANQNSSIVTQCAVNPATGAFSGCVNSSATGLSGAFGFAIENGFAYIANQFSNTVSVCKVNPVTGALSGCGYTGIGFGSPKGIAIRNGFAYITNQSSGDVISCAANSSTGLLTSCNVTGNGFNNPVGIATN
ncbi:MAG: Ig-like domain-containing protein [Burkholderiales bacterium]|nr:Ig-like domain-containing protein [Burkholderiales bacterium]